MDVINVARKYFLYVSKRRFVMRYDLRIGGFTNESSALDQIRVKYLELNIACLTR